MSVSSTCVGQACKQFDHMVPVRTNTRRCTRCCRYPPGSQPDLNMTIRLVDGDEVIADSAADGGIDAACAKFKAWVRQKFFAAAAV